MAAPKKSEPIKPVRVTKGKVERDLQSFRDIADDVVESDFVPYACLFNPNTIATKDGELLQTIKITGLGFEATTGKGLRQAIRQAIRQALPDASYGIWLHTLRRQQSLVARAHFPDAFSGQLDEAWNATQPHSASFVNELYITIVKAGKPVHLRDFSSFLRNLIPSRAREAYTAELEQMNEDLSHVTREMLSVLALFGARLLTVVERDGICYSEQLEFLEKLINLENRPMEVREIDLSQQLTSGEITFGYNAMEVRTHEGHRRFAAILTLKEYKESTLAGIDKFLEIPCEIIVSQCFGFSDADTAREAYARQADLLAMSGDTELAKWMEIDSMQQDDASYGQQQTTLFLIAPSVKQLEANVKLVQRAMSRLGMVIIREDLRFEECYWAQLPANFTFVARKNPVNIKHLAGFANLQSAPMGVATGSPWGPPVTLLSTVQDTPYFFNFHRGAGAHTILLGKRGTGRTSFTHFLMAQARKLPLRIWYLDSHGYGQATINAMGGTYVRPASPALKFNPFHLPASAENREFLALWLSTLIDPHGLKLNRSTLTFFQMLVDQVLALPRASRRLSSILPMAREADALLANSLSAFCAGGKYGELFDMPEDNFQTSNLCAWDISPWMGAAETRIPLTSYLLHCITAALDGKPTLLVMDEGFLQLDTPIFSSRASEWFDYLTAQNTGCFISTASAQSSGSIPFTSALAQKAATIFAFPDADPDPEYAMGFGFTAQEMATLSYIDGASTTRILQKRGDEAVVLAMDFSSFPEPTREILSGKPKRTPAEELAALMGQPA